MSGKVRQHGRLAELQVSALAIGTTPTRFHPRNDQNPSTSDRLAGIPCEESRAPAAKSKIAWRYWLINRAALKPSHDQTIGPARACPGLRPARRCTCVSRRGSDFLREKSRRRNNCIPVVLEDDGESRARRRATSDSGRFAHIDGHLRDDFDSHRSLRRLTNRVNGPARREKALTAQQRARRAASVAAAP